MDVQNGGYQPGSDLPRPHNESSGLISAEDVLRDAPKKAEVVSQAAEMPLASQPAQPVVQDTKPSSIPPPTPPDLSQTQPSTIAVTNTTPPMAEDSDLIEQEWVSKAKAIVESTKDDPHAQNKEINKIKADYIKKRYNKEIKVTTD